MPQIQYAAPDPASLHLWQTRAPIRFTEKSQEPRNLDSCDTVPSIMPPSSNSKTVEVISLLDDDSDAEDAAVASSTKRPSPTSVAAAHMNGSETGKNKRRKGDSASAFVHNADAIDLLEDSEDEALAEASEKPTDGNPSPPDIKPIIASAAAASAVDQADSDVEEVEANASEWRSATGGGGTTGTGQPKDDRAYESDTAAAADDDEEFEIVATKGQNALADFPHSRANCVTHPFASGDKKTHCDNCYCYVCDMPAAECQVWDSHCKANHEDHRWREERERFKRLGVEAALAPAAATAAAASTSATAVTTPSMSSNVIRGRVWSRSARRPARPAPNAEFSVRKLLQMVTTVHPVEISPPAGSGFTTDLRHYQKQSLAFMVDVERASTEDNQKMRGGWLADEVGMGKVSLLYRFSLCPYSMMFLVACALPLNSIQTPNCLLKICANSRRLSLPLLQQILRLKLRCPRNRRFVTTRTRSVRMTKSVLLVFLPFTSRRRRTMMK